MNYLTNTLKSKYCLLTLILSLFLTYFLIPKHVFYGWFKIIAIIFMISASLNLTCLIRNIKERIKIAKTYKNSVLSLIGIGLGFGALQVCGVGAPICGASIGAGLISVFFPGLHNFLFEYSIHIIILAIILQFIALYFMNCFKPYHLVCKNLTKD